MMRFNAALARRVALILGLSFPAFSNALAEGRAVMPPRWMVEAYLSDALVKPSRDDIARAIIPGLGMVPAFLGGGLTPPTEFTTTGNHTVPASFWSSATTVTAECIGGGSGSSSSNFSGGGGAYSKRNSYSLAGLTALYLVVAIGRQGNGTAQDTIVRENNSTGTIIALAQGSGSATGGAASAGTGDVKYNGGNGTAASNAAGGGAAGPAGAGGAGASGVAGSGGGSPAGAGGLVNNNGNNYGGGGGGLGNPFSFGGQGWIRLTFAI